MCICSEKISRLIKNNNSFNHHNMKCFYHMIMHASSFVHNQSKMIFYSHIFSVKFISLIF